MRFLSSGTPSHVRDEGTMGSQSSEVLAWDSVGSSLECPAVRSNLEERAWQSNTSCPQGQVARVRTTRRLPR